MSGDDNTLYSPLEEGQSAFLRAFLRASLLWGGRTGQLQRASSPASGGGLGAGKPKPGGEDTVAP